MKNNNGFTFIELFFAMIILSIGLLAMAKMSTSSVITGSFSNKMTASTTLAQEKVEELKKISYSTTLTSASHNSAETTLDEDGTTGSGIFARTVTITNGAANQLTTIQVDAQWTDMSIHTFSITTMLAQ